MITLQSKQARVIHGRDGSVVVEVVLAAALLATAGVGLSKLVGRSQIVARQSDQRLAAALIATNVIERLKVTDADQVETVANRLQLSAIESTGYDVQVTIKPIQGANSNLSGSHIRVEIIADDSVRVVMHDWRFWASQGPLVLAEESE